ncbi:leucine-rich repeat-containing protein 37A-like isoform X3 [Chionomys nivalis]|uniref:leucine-rich repeat-containing protein 37A-like isoform X3 n=1 Tax=Chionomys nivalis TaxID=269649 RepID=UPI0025942104|nr:leucine-rich repeat-containing protein 37A-like isoform X3 [Chionomys nivalis]
MSLLHFGALRLFFIWQLVLAFPIPEFTGNPRQSTSEPWVLTKLWSWHPSDQSPKSRHIRAPETDKGGTEYLGPPAPKEILAPLEELTDSLLLFQDPSTSRESNPEPAELGVSHQHLTNKLIPPGKQPENILTPNGDRVQAPIWPSQFKSTASLAEAADHQLGAILVPPLDSQSSRATTFMISPKELKKDLTQHRKLAKVVDGKPQFHKQTKDDDYGDLSMNEAYSYSLPLQSQENADEAPEFLEQDEPDQLETQVQNTENLHQEAPDYFPQEDEPLIQKEDSAHHQLPSEESSVHPEIRGPSPNRNEAQHSNLPNVTVNPVASEADKEVQATVGQQQTLAQFAESSELLEPSSTQQEAPAQILELPENLGNSGSHLKAPALPTKLPEETSPLVEQEGTVPVPESSMQSITETVLTTIQNPSQVQFLHYTSPMITGKPADMEPKITFEPRTENESSPYEEETPTQIPGPPVETEHFISQQQQPTELSEYSEEAESSGVDLESPVQPQEETEELGPLPMQPEDLSQHPGPLLEDDSNLSELEQPGQLSESPEEVELGSGNQPEASVQPAELPPVEQEAPLQTPESPIENVVETPTIHKVQPDPNEEHHYYLPHVTVRPVDVALTITSEPTKETESSLTQQASPVHPLEYTEQMEPFLHEEKLPAQASEPSGEGQFQSQLEVPAQALEYAEEFKPSATEQEQAAQSPEHHEVTDLPPDHYQAQHSSLSYVTGQPADLEITVTENPVAAMGTVYHEATASEEVELSKQQGVLYQPPEPILHHKPLSQQEDTTGISQISEEGKPFPAQQETSEQMLELPDEELPGYHEVTVSSLGHGQVYFSASHNIPIDHQTNPKEDHHSPVSQGVPTQPEEFPEEPYPSQQGSSTWPSITDRFSSSADLEATFRTELPKSYKTTVKHVDLELTITPEPSLKDGSVPLPQADLRQPIDSTEKGKFSQIQTNTLSKRPYFSKTESLAFQEAIAQTTHHFKEVHLYSTQQEASELPPSHSMGVRPFLHQQITLSHPTDLHENPKPFLALKPTAAQTLKLHRKGKFSLTHKVIPHPPKPLKNIVTHIPAHKMTVPRPDQDQVEYTLSPNGLFQPLDLEVTVTPGISPETKPYILPKRTVNPHFQVKLPHPHHSESQHPNPTKNPIQPLDLEVAVNLKPKEKLSQTMQETTNQVTELPEESLTQGLEYHEMTIPIPTQDQAKYPASLTVSFQPLDLELPLTSEPTREPQHPTVPQHPPHPNPTEATVQPLELELTITHKTTAEGEHSQTIPETTSLITEPPKEVVAQEQEYQEATVPTETEHQVVPSSQPLDLELTITSEPTREPQHPTVPQHPQHPNSSEATVQPLELELTITHKTTAEGEHSQTIPETTSLITEPLPAPVYQEMKVPTPGQDQIEYPTTHVVSFQPLDLELTITSEPTREAKHPTTPKHPLVIYPESIHFQHPNPTEATAEPLDLELTIAPQLTTEGEFSQSIQETTTQITEPPKEAVALAPVYQEVTVPIPTEDQAVVSFRPLDLELTESSEPTREPHHPTTPRETTVPPPEYPLVIYPEPVHSKHTTQIPEVTVQHLNLELTVTYQPINEGELSQSMHESTTQITAPPKEGVVQEVTVPIPIQGQAENPAPPRISSQPSQPPTGTHFRPTPQETSVHHSDHSVILNPEVFVPRTRTPTKTVVNLDRNSSTLENSPENLQRTTAEVRKPPKVFVVQTRGYEEGMVQGLIQSKAEYLTKPYHPLDMELTVTAEPTTEGPHPTALSETTDRPVHSQVTPLEQVHIQPPNTTEITVHPPDLEVTITHQPTTEGGLFEPVQKTSQPPQPHEGLVTKAPGFHDSKAAMPSYQTQHTVSPEVQVYHLDVEHALTELSKIESEPLEAPGNITTLPLNNPEEVLPLDEKIQVQNSNLTQVTAQYLHSEFSITRQPNTMVKGSAPMKDSPAHTSEIPMETEAQFLEHYETAALTLVHVEAQRSDSSTIETKPSQVLETAAASTEAAQYGVSTTTAASPEAAHSTVPTTTAPTPKCPEITLPPTDQFSKMELTITPYSENSTTEKDLTMEQNAYMYINLCEFCLCENETLLCVHLSPERRLHQVPVPKPDSYNDTFTNLNFQGNNISYIDKNVWRAYRWAEKLNLSENHLTELHKDSFEGLLSLQILILSHNPLTIVEDPYFFKLPALKYLDLGTTQVQLTTLGNIFMMTLQLGQLILPRHMACCLCKYKTDIEVVCKTVKLHCHTGCLTNTTHCLEDASIGNPEGAFMKLLQTRKENNSTELIIESETGYSDQENAKYSSSMEEEIDFNDENDVMSALNYILPYFSEGNLEDVVSTMLPYIKLLFSQDQDSESSLGSLQNDTQSLLPTNESESDNFTNKNKLNKLYFLEKLLNEEIDEVKKEEQTILHKEKSNNSGKKFKRKIFQKKWAPAQAEENSLAEIEKAEKRLRSLNRVLKRIVSIQKRHFKGVSDKSLWNKQSVQTPVESIAKDGQLRSPPTAELQQLSLVQKPRTLVGNSFHPEPLLPKEHGEAVSSSPEQSLVDKTPTTKSLPEFIDRRKDLSYTIFILESANANVKRTKGSSPSLLSEKRHRNLRKKNYHFRLIAKSPASSAVRSLVNSPAGGVFSSLGDLSYAEKPFSELDAALEPPSKKPLAASDDIDDIQETIFEPTTPMSEEPISENIFPEITAVESFGPTYNLIPTGITAPEEAASENIPSGNPIVESNVRTSDLIPTDITMPEEGASENIPSENPAVQSNVPASDLITTLQQASKPQLDFILGPDSHEFAYSLLMSPGERFESQLNQQLRPLIPNNNVRRLISHVIRTLKMDCSDPSVQLSCAKLISRTGLLMKLLSEQQEFKLSRADWDTDQWKTNNYINESPETKGGQKGLEPSQSTKEVPGYGYNNKVILAISVTVVVTVLIIIFFLVEQNLKDAVVKRQRRAEWAPELTEQVYSHRTKEEDEEKSIGSKKCYKDSESQEGFFWLRWPQWLTDLFKRDIRKKSMTEGMQVKESSAEEDTTIQDVSWDVKEEVMPPGLKLSVTEAEESEGVVKKLCTKGRGGLLDHGSAQTTQKHLLSQKDSLLSGEERAGALAGIIFKKRKRGVYVRMG